MEENQKVLFTGLGKSSTVNVGDLARELMKVCKDKETNPINLGMSIEEFIEINEAMESNQKKKSNGFLEGKKMNRILGKR